MTPGEFEQLSARMRALDKLIALAMAEQSAIWRHITSAGGGQPKTDIGIISMILDECASEFAVPRADLLGDRRYPRAAMARHAAYWLAREMTPMSYPTIGRLVKRDHTTVMHGVSVIEKRITHDGELQHQITNLQAALATRLHPDAMKEAA